MAATLFVLGGVANAAGITIGPGGVTVDPGYNNSDPGYDSHHRHHHGISQDDAVSIARHNGVRHVDSVDRHRGDYEVSGTDRHHHDITVTVDGDTGEVIDIDRS